jgi:DNA-binding protein YbaB
VAGFYDDPDVALARVAADIEAARLRAERAVEVKASIDRVRGRARSARGEVTVETDATGQITDLVLDEAALNLRASDLATLIRDTVRAAARDAGARAVAVTDDAYGPDSTISAHLRDELEARSR